MSGFNLDRLMDKIYEPGRNELSSPEKDNLLNELHSDRWLCLQRLMIQEINGRLNKLANAKLGEPGALEAMSKIQGEVVGIRAFWNLVEELVKQTEAKENQQ